MLKNFRLKQRFSIFLIGILIVGLTLIGVSLANILKQYAENQVTAKALILMETMNSVREYTNTQVKPQIADASEVEFLPQTIPAYSAREVFESLRRQPAYRNFFYKEATLNPSNLRDKADPFETTLVQKFIGNKNVKEMSGFRDTAGSALFYIARPIKITNPSCLECHSTPELAPKSVIDRYGSVNGMGWKLNDIVGAQIISVPAQTVINEAQKSFLSIVGIVSLVFVAVILFVNYLLDRNVIRPLNRMAKVAEQVSTGYMDAEFEEMSNDEIGNLAKAFKRMKLSLVMAMSRLSQSGRISRVNKGQGMEDRE
jgi:HAMP domain-containing protein